MLLVFQPGCDKLSKSVLLRLKAEPGTENIYVTTFAGQLNRWREDSLTAKRAISYVITTFETFPPSESDTIVKMIARDSSSWRITNLLDSTTSDSSMVGQDILTTMSARGQLIDLEFLAKSEEMDLSYNRAFYEQTFPVFPMEPVMVGREWTQTTKVIQNGSPLEASITFVVKSFEKLDGFDVAAIGYDGIAIIPFPAKKGDSTFISAFNRLKVTGTIWYDHQRGGMYKQTEHRLLTGQRLATEQPGDTIVYRMDGVYDMETIRTESRPALRASSTDAK